LAPPKTVKIGLTGDLGLGRYISTISRSKKDFSYPFAQTSFWLQENDFNLSNLESPITSPCPQSLTGSFTFCGDERFLPYLKENKFVLNLNNNHILNYGQKGLSQTKDYLQTDYFYDNFFQKTINDIKFGFLGFDLVTDVSLRPRNGGGSNPIIEKIKLYDSQVDYLIVSIHWGNEYLPQPEKWRIEFAHSMIDAGADIIHGHHPHVYQEKEIYQDKYIYYSLGNFIFDQSWSWETSHSNLIRLTLNKDKIIEEEIFPYEIKNNSQPVLLSK
jgi:poly-gamma-glutamate synthesis protein (capsule biosynthesis protein)